MRTPVKQGNLLKSTTNPNFQVVKNYHDGQLVAFKIGPRHECRLDIHLNVTWNNGADKSATVRFGAIQNMPEVETFFKKMDTTRINGRYLSEILDLDCIGKNMMKITFDAHGELIICCGKFTESNERQVP